MDKNSNKLLPKHIKDELWRRGELSFLCHPEQKKMRDIYYNAPKHSLPVWLLARQSGKCLAKDTLVATIDGPKHIQDLNVGDYIYGYNEDGSVSPTKVVAVESQGVKEVFDLKHRNRIVASATGNHKWPIYNTLTNDYEEVTTEDILKYRYKKIKRVYFDYVDGEIHEPHAYAIGAMLGDGYSPDHGKQYWISSIDNKIPNAVASELGGYAHKNKGNNYTWAITSHAEGLKGGVTTLTFNHYDWMKGKLAHEKTCDINIIKTWTRESQLRFLAGLIDTDGCIQVTGRTKNELKISLSMQAKSVIDAANFIILSLFQVEMCYKLDNRTKYKNGPVHQIYTNNNFCSQRILKAITPYLVSDHKKYKSNYDKFPHYNHVPYYLGVIEGGTRMVETYDIQVDNKTNLYVLANGIVTHNSWLLCTLALEEALRKPNSIVKIITDTKIHAKNIFVPKFTEILDTCPVEIKPEFRANEYSFIFHNGSQIQLAGTDNKHYERLRGQTTTAAFIDEAGFCSDLEDVINSVLIPTTTHTGGKIVLSSTPPKDYDHPFISFMEKAEIEGLLTKKTIDDNPLLSKEQIAIIEKQMGGRNSEQFRREYLCEILKLSTDSALPEVNDELLEKIVKEWPKPAHYDVYASMDLGFQDMTAVLFGYYDFRKDKLIIEDEIPFDFKQKDKTIKTLVSEIQKKEEELWNNSITNEIRRPLKRVSDINHIVTNEIRSYDPNLTFTNPVKDDKKAAVNNLRVMLVNHKIIISPKCTTLIRHLKNVKWTKKGDEFARSVDDSHYDFVDALIYMMRSINYKKNPYPNGYGMDLREEDVFIANPKSFYKNDNKDVFRVIMGHKKR